MLELRQYTHAELSAILGTQSTEGMKRKLENYCVEYEAKGRGQQTTFDIRRIGDPFRFTCVFDLGFPPQTDFEKLSYFVFYFFNDDEFPLLPIEAMSERLRDDKGERRMSRQTISNYLHRLWRKDFIDMRGEAVYYFASGDYRRMVGKAEYAKAWREYWAAKEEGVSPREAIAEMRRVYGGVARKHYTIGLNVFYASDIETLVRLACERIETEKSC